VVELRCCKFYVFMHLVRFANPGYMSLSATGEPSTPARERGAE